jgi:hypothetical protein
MPTCVDPPGDALQPHRSFLFLWVESVEMDGANILNFDDSGRNTLPKIQQTNRLVVHQNFKAGINRKFVSNQISDIAVRQCSGSAS